MCAAHSSHAPSEQSLADGDRAATEGRWRDAEALWRAAGTEHRLRWLQRQRQRPEHRRRALALWWVALLASAVLLVLLTFGTSATPVAVVSLALTAVALVAMLPAAIATGRWLDGTGEHQ